MLLDFIIIGFWVFVSAVGLGFLFLGIQSMKERFNRRFRKA